MPLFIKSIDPELKILGPLQQFNFNQNTAISQINNGFQPTISIPCITNSEIRNKNLSGFRLIHNTSSTDNTGSLKLQSFINAQSTGTDIFTVNNNGILTFNSAVSFTTPPTNLFNYPNNTGVYLNGFGNWVDPFNSINTNLAGYGIRLNSTHPSPSAIQYGIENNGVGKAAFGHNSVEDATYVWSYGNNIKFGLLGLETGRITAQGMQFTTNLTGYGIRLNSTNASAFAIQYGVEINGVGKAAFGHNNLNNETYLYSYGTIIKIGLSGNEIGRFTNNALGIGTVSPSAYFHANGGIQNVSGEDSCIRATSSSAAANIEIDNIATNGRLYALQSRLDGSFDIADRTGGQSIFRRLPIGYYGFGGIIAPHGEIHLPASIMPRKHILYESANNDHQFYGFGVGAASPGVAGFVRYQVANINSDHVFFAGASTTTSNEIGRITGAGDAIIPGTIYARLPSGLLYMQGNVTTNAITANVWAKVNGTTTSSLLNDFLMVASNRLQYNDTKAITVQVTTNVTTSHNIATGTLSYAIYKNGAQVTSSIMRSYATTGILVNISTSAILTLTLGDYVEVYCTCSANATVTTSNLILIATMT